MQGIPVPDESDNEPELRNFLESVFNSPESFNLCVETAFLVHKAELVKGKVSLDAMQTYAARFAATLDDWVLRSPDLNDRALNECLVTYFYKGIEPEPLRSLVQHFCVEHVSDVFHQFRVQCTASVVAMVNLKTEKSLRDRQFCARQQQQISELSRPLGGERRAKKTDSAGTKIVALLEESLLPIFDCENCGGTHKSMNCKSKAAFASPRDLRMITSSFTVLSS